MKEPLNNKYMVICIYSGIGIELHNSNIAILCDSYKDAEETLRKEWEKILDEETRNNPEMLMDTACYCDNAFGRITWEDGSTLEYRIVDNIISYVNEDVPYICTESDKETLLSAYNEYAGRVFGDDPIESFVESGEVGMMDSKYLSGYLRCIGQKPKNASLSVWIAAEEVIPNSMCLDSGTSVCSYREDNDFIDVMVRGHVTVYFEGEKYIHFSDMPKELQVLFESGKAYDDDRVHIVENNWYEAFYTRDEETCEEGSPEVFDVIDIAGSSIQQLKEELAITMKDLRRMAQNYK